MRLLRPQVSEQVAMVAILHRLRRDHDVRLIARHTDRCAHRADLDQCELMFEAEDMKHLQHSLLDGDNKNSRPP